MYAYFNIYRIAFSPHVGFFAGWGNEHIFGYLEDSPPPSPIPIWWQGKGPNLQLNLWCLLGSKIEK